MVCIYCGSKTQVTNSRPQKRLNQIWRRRECVRCHAVFTSEEKADYSGSIVVRTDKQTQPFSRDKLFASILRSLGHRQTAIEDASALSATIIARLLQKHQKPVLQPSEIVLIAHETLARFDNAASVQYQAYHRVDSSS